MTVLIHVIESSYLYMQTNYLSTSKYGYVVLFYALLANYMYS